MAAEPESGQGSSAVPQHGGPADQDIDDLGPPEHAATGDDAAGNARAEGATAEDPVAGSDAAPHATPTDPWAPLLEAGLQWFAALAAPPASAADAGLGDHRAPRVTIDPASGERSLTLPLPDPATLRRLAEGLTGLLERLQRQSQAKP